jgi:pyruvate kinase
MRRAKIVATIGPASASPEVLRKLIGAGVDVARLNFSHGTLKEHAGTIQAIRDAAEAAGKPVAILQDLQGPRIRVGSLLHPVTVVAGDAVTLTTTTEPGDGQIPVTYAQLPQDVRPGNRIMIDDGLIELRAEAITPLTVQCRVVTGGIITAHKGMNLPGVSVSAPTLAEKDREDLSFGVMHKLDYVALSFVRDPQDLTDARDMIKRLGGDIPIIAKIERPEAIERLEEIIAVADGIMIARGDLATETSPEAVPVVQKRIIRACNRARVPVITATQMLESMTDHPRPTRAEASDVANAVFDGTDAVMLSAETAAGRYPLESVQTMVRIVEAAEAGQQNFRTPDPSQTPLPFPAAICAAAARSAVEIQAKVVVVFTESGTTARLISKERPPAPIIAYTPHDPIRRRMALYWGVLPRATEVTEGARLSERRSPESSRLQSAPGPREEGRVLARPGREGVMGGCNKNTDQLIIELERSLREEKLVKSGDRIVILLGAPVGTRGGTNLMKLHTIS